MFFYITSSGKLKKKKHPNNTNIEAKSAICQVAVAPV